MANCGIGACSSTPKSCGMEIANMLLKIGEGIFTAVTTILSFGTASAATAAAKASAKAAVKSAVRKVGKSALKGAFKKLKQFLKNGMKDFLKKKAISKLKAMKELVKDLLKDKLKSLALYTVCGKVWDALIGKTVSVSEKEVTDSVIDTVDVLGIKGVVTSCSNTASDKGLGCAKGVVDLLSTFDPTGLFSIVSAFIQPICDVPVRKPDYLKIDLNDPTKSISGAAEGCTDMKFSAGKLSSNCGSSAWNVDMNKCFGNNDGRLERGVNFHHTCKDCKLDSDGNIDCNCRRRNQSWRRTKVQLMSILKNNNGKLSC
jgi:hypothetical protein